MDDYKIFHPMIWRWANQRQVKIKIHANRREVTVKGSSLDIEEVEAEWNQFCRWLRECKEIKIYAKAVHGLRPQVLYLDDGSQPVQPQQVEQLKGIRARIARVTDPERPKHDVWDAACSARRTRESRMEVVAWIAITEFEMLLEGGFVRDWIVRGAAERDPATPSPKNWATRDPTTCVYELNKLVTPADLDMHLPHNKEFEIGVFAAKILNYGISIDYYKFDGWRHLFMCDVGSPTGPFSMDLIEPHIAVVQDRLDFDVSNITCVRGYTAELGMRVTLFIYKKKYISSFLKIKITTTGGQQRSSRELGHDQGA
jgi:hypothetical protein